MVVSDGFQVLPARLSSVDITAMRGAIQDSIDRVARVMLTPYETSCAHSPIEERIERVARRAGGSPSQC
jgi:hypothetical protein